MTTAFLDRVPVERITDRARAARPGRSLLAVLAALLFALGWVAAKTVRGVWLAAAWCVCAVLVGWQEGRNVQRPG